MAIGTTHSNLQQLLVGLFIGVGGLFVAFVVTVQVMSGEGNTLANLGKYLCVGGFLVGFIAPKPTLFILFLACGYLDMIKRLMILWSMPNLLDLYYVLGIAPLTLFGVALALVVPALVGKGNWSGREYFFLFVSVALVVASGAMAYMHSGVAGALKGVADGGAYSVLLFAMPLLFNDAASLQKFLRYLTIAFIPVAAYGLYQGIYGLSAFEIAYLESGLTLESRQLADKIIRPPSTLNSATALGTVSAMLMVVSWLAWACRGDKDSRLRRSKIIAFLLSLLYFGSLLAALNRSSHVIWLLAIGGILSFGSRLRTGLLYFGAVASFFWLCYNAEWLLDKLPEWDAIVQAKTGGSDFGSMMTRVQTFGDRLIGMRNLVSSPRMWTFFGVAEKDKGEVYGEVYSHDMVGGLLIDFGAVPLFFALLVLVVSLVKIHRAVWAKLERDPASRVFVLGNLSLLFGVFIQGVFFGNILRVFPVNAFFWAIGGLLVVVLGRRKQEEEAIDPETIGVALPRFARS